MIIPHVHTRLTEQKVGQQAQNLPDPKVVGEVITFLCHESCGENGSCFEINQQRVQALRYERNEGLGLNFDFKAETVRQNRQKLNDYSNPEYPQIVADTMPRVIENATKNKEKLEEERAKQTQQSQPAEQESDLKSDEHFSMIGAFLDSGEGKKLVAEINAIYGFEIKKTKKGEVVKTFTIDLKNGQGKVVVGKSANPDATFTMTDDDFDLVSIGKLNPQVAFTQGRMKIKGSMKKASMFKPGIFPPSTPENKAKYLKAKL
eukprot:TRINITY_DN620_c0_g1_i2.p1 TRINITY_DN620_c0_g1~~TRINITY_DN620_c0_g1_i2.p1  ORF type:complete len:261 (-),score=60.69 TRINITY_DN620_c0_g1_i2:118-900(-)